MRKIIAYFSIFSDAKITRESLVIESLSEMSLDSVYLPPRQNLLVEVKAHMHDYFQHETSVLHELYKEIWHNAQLTLSHNLPVIIDSGKTEVLQLDVLDIRTFSST